MADTKPVESDQLTPAERKVVLGVLKHMTNNIEADFEAVAAELGYKNAGVAKDRWRQIRAKKFRPATESPLGGVAKSTPSKKSPDKAKKVVGEAGARGSSKKRKRQLKVEVMDDDEVGHGNIKAEEDAEDAGEADAEGDE